MKKKTISIANYMRDFQCLGSDCEDTCCQGWYVNIDKKTFVKYKRISDKKTRTRIQKHLRRNKYNTSFSDYATIQMEENGFCPFLNSNKLCSIQLEMGSSYLSRTCATYPRQYTELFDRYELTGAVSCPEIARLVLLNKEGIRMEAFQEREDRDSVLDRVLDDEQYLDLFEPIRQFVRDILAERNMPVMDRLLVMGQFLKSVTQLQAEEKLSDIEPLIQRYRQLVQSGEWKVQLKELPLDVESQLAFLSDSVNSYVNQGAVQQRYRAVYEECCQGWSSPEVYQEAYRTYFIPFLDEYGYMLDNYLDNYCLSMLFPFSNTNLGQTPFDDWVILGLHAALIQFHLIGLAHARQGLAVEDVLLMFQTFARTFEHDITYFSNSLTRLKEAGLASLPFFSVLLTHER